MNTSLRAQRLLALFGLVLLGMLGACATPSEPCSYNFRDQRFVGAATSVLTNEYQRCTEHLLDKLADLEVQVQAAKRETERLETLAEQSGADRRRALTRLAQTNQSSQKALNDLNTLRRDLNQDQGRLNELVNQQADLEQRKKRTTTQALDGEAEQLQTEIAALEAQQRALQAQIDQELES